MGWTRSIVERRSCCCFCTFHVLVFCAAEVFGVSVTKDRLSLSRGGGGGAAERKRLTCVTRARAREREFAQLKKKRRKKNE